MEWLEPTDVVGGLVLLAAAQEAAQWPVLHLALRRRVLRGERFGACASHVHWMKALGRGRTAARQLWRLAPRTLGASAGGARPTNRL